MKDLPYPKTKEEWWYNVDEAWNHLLAIMECYLDLDSHKGDGLHPQDLTLRDHIKNLKHKKDPELVRWFSRAWLNAPDSPDIHYIPHWGTLCDLCSEEWVLDPEEDNHE